MKRYSRRSAVVLALATALLACLVAAPLAVASAAADPPIQAAPLSEAFRQYQAQQRLQRALGLNGVVQPNLGMIPEPMDPSILKGTAGTARVRSVVPPVAYDLRSLGKLTPVRDQNPFGTCWTFASLASLESCLLPAEARDFSEDHMTLTSGFDDGGDPYNEGGNYYMATAYLARWGGPVDETDDAYGDGFTPPGLSPDKHVQEVLYIPGGDIAADTKAIKTAIMTYGAVATSLYWTNSAYDESENSYYYFGLASIDHAVTIVGWDDTFSATRFGLMPPGNGAWLVRNSWGTEWGDGGYFWVSYWDAHCGRDNVFNAVYPNAEPTTNHDTIYYHDPLGQVDTLGYGDETAWGANVYTATASQAVTAVGFFTHVPGTTYSVYTGGVTGGGAPGTLTKKASGTINTAGYHTVRLSSPRGVVRGGKFAVAVKLRTPGLDYPIAYEGYVADFSSGATASPRQSYMRHTDASLWLDLTRYDPTGNVCLKAYADDDTQAPTSTVAAPASVGRYARVTLRFRVNDPQPSCGSAAVRIQILKGASVVRTITVGTKGTNTTAGYIWTATLGKGVYTWRVSAIDLAGYPAAAMVPAALVIR